MGDQYQELAGAADASAAAAAKFGAKKADQTAGEQYESLVAIGAGGEATAIPADPEPNKTEYEDTSRKDKTNKERRKPSNKGHQSDKRPRVKPSVKSNKNTSSSKKRDSKKSSSSNRTKNTQDSQSKKETDAISFTAKERKPKPEPAGKAATVTETTEKPEEETQVDMEPSGLLIGEVTKTHDERDQPQDTDFMDSLALNTNLWKTVKPSEKQQQQQPQDKKEADGAAPVVIPITEQPKPEPEAAAGAAAAAAPAARRAYTPRDYEESEIPKAYYEARLKKLARNRYWDGVVFSYRHWKSRSKCCKCMNKLFCNKCCKTMCCCCECCVKCCNCCDDNPCCCCESHWSRILATWIIVLTVAGLIAAPILILAPYLSGRTTTASPYPRG